MNCKKAISKRNVLSLFLKTDTQTNYFLFLIDGTAFHSTTNARSYDP